MSNLHATEVKTELMNTTKGMQIQETPQTNELLESSKMFKRKTTKDNLAIFKEHMA
jgi:hypothetical protein